MTDERDLPEGVTDAAPAGGWDQEHDKGVGRAQRGYGTESAEKDAIQGAEATQVADLDSFERRTGRGRKEPLTSD
jgi:hypothetical protein